MLGGSLNFELFLHDEHRKGAFFTDNLFHDSVLSFSNPSGTALLLQDYNNGH